MLTLGPALEMQTAGGASHPAVISKQTAGNSFRSTGSEFPMLSSFKDTGTIFLTNKGLAVATVE